MKRELRTLVMVVRDIDKFTTPVFPYYTPQGVFE